MEKKLYIFKNPEWAKSEKIFTHYWTNEGENYFDTVYQTNDDKGHTVETEYEGNPTEAYLQQFKLAGYSWVPLDSTRYQHETITEITVQMSDRDWDENPTLFFKIVNEEHGLETDIPLYYYSYSISESSDQNYGTTSYTVKCKLDMWATYWCRMHSLMKKCNENIDFVQKMCNRFIYNEQFDEEGNRVDSQGFIIDYLKQPYLTISGKYPKNLIVNDDRENFLTLEEWLFINSGKQDSESYEQWLKDTWMRWSQHPFAGIFNPNDYIKEGVESKFNAEDFGKIQNKWAEELENGFYDTDYNSNSKYRYLVCKVGNNTPPSSLIEGKPQGMFTKFDFQTKLEIPNKKVSIAGLGSGEWEEYKPFNYKCVKAINGLSGITEGAICIYWDKWLIDGKHLTFRFDPYKIIQGGTIQYPSNYVTWNDGFQQKTYRKILNGFVFGKEYPLFELPSKSYAFDIYGDYVNVNLRIDIRFNNADSADLIFKLWFDRDFQIPFAERYLKVKTYLEENAVINDIYISQTGQSIISADAHINGESLMLLPFKKGVEELKYIEYLNSTNKGILMGDGSVLGMPINDIPPAVLALAIRRQNDESEYQTIGDIMSVRHVLNDSKIINCPLDLVNFNLGDLQMPAIFTGFESIPVVVARAPLRENIYQCVGGNKFFNYYFDILTNDYLSKNWETFDLETQTLIKHGGNCPEAEPFLYGPQFWKWSYFIDGNHILELTGDKIDFVKLMTDENWEVKLNTSFNNATNYFLDISEIKNNKYPMSKLGMEYVTTDPANFPFTTEAYNNWLQNNQLTQETSKNANEIANRYARTGAIISGTTEGIATMATLTAQAAAGGGFISKAAAIGVGSTMGAMAGAAKAAGIIAGAENAIAQANEEWQNKWNAELGNRYSSPSQLNPNGFNSGNLVYSTIGNANQNSYELFRTFSLSDIDKQKVWYDISINGYPFLSQCPYIDYNNRINFNVINCNLFDKYYIVANYLMEHMFNISPMLSQGDAINSFMEKCQKKFRVFKCEYNIDHMDEIIGRNIELVREWVQPYYAPKRVVTIDVARSIFDNQDDENYLNNNYQISYSEGKNTITKKNLPIYSELIPYEDALYCEGWEDFLEKYSAVALGNNNSNAFMRIKEWDQSEFKTIQESLAFNSSEYGPEDLYLPNNNVFINAIKSNDYLNKAITISKDGVLHTPGDNDKYTLGWNLKVEDAGDNKNLKITLAPTSNWTITEPTDLTSGTIDNVRKNISIQNVPLNDKMSVQYDNFNKDHNELHNMYPIYHDGTWLNHFPILDKEGQKKSHITYYEPSTVPLETFKGAIISGNLEQQYFTHKYNSLGYNIQNKNEFRKYFKKIKFHVEANIGYKKRWSGQPEEERNLFGFKDVELDIPQTSDTLTKTFGIEIGMDIQGRSDLQEYHYDYLLNQRSDKEIAECFGGQVSCGKGITLARTNALKGTFFGIVTVKLELKNDEFVITQQNQIFYNGYGTHGDFAWTDSTYGSLVKRGMEDHPKELYFSISRDDNLQKLSYKAKVNNVVLVGNGSIESAKTRWNMNNLLNSIVFIRKEDENYFKNKSYILTQNKKED